MFNEQQKKELFKALMIFFWGGVGYLAVLALVSLGFDISELEAPIITIAVNAIVFAGYRLTKQRQQPLL